MQRKNGKKNFVRTLCFTLALCFAFSFSACADTTAKGSVENITESGDAVLDIMPQKLLELADIGDTVLVKVGDFSGEMLLVNQPAEEDGVVQLYLDNDEWRLSVRICNESFCDKYDVDVGAKVRITRVES